jgi:hypothetical protein
MEKNAAAEEVPALISPGYLMMHAERTPPSKEVPLASRKGVNPA